MSSARQGDLFGGGPDLPEGVTLMAGRIGLEESRAMLDEVASVLSFAPPYRLAVASGGSMSARMTNCGLWGWHSDEKGYRYVSRHPETGTVWPAIPRRLKRAATAAAEAAGVAGFEPDCCLINLYDADGRMGLHQDKDEADFAWPIVSFSFGADALFALGGDKRRDAATSFTLSHGDVLAMHGPARLRFHGVKKIAARTAPFAHDAIPDQGRLNLTFRRAK